MKTKVLEIRDEGTCIPVVAMQMLAANAVEARYLWREGYPADGSSITVMRLSDQGATNDPYGWPGGTRTMSAAHHWILEHWDELSDGDVVDVRVLLELATEPAAPEIWTGFGTEVGP